MLFTKTIIDFPTCTPAGGKEINLPPSRSIGTGTSDSISFLTQNQFCFLTPITQGQLYPPSKKWWIKHYEGEG